MNLLFLLDTNIVSEPLRTAPDASIMACFACYEGQYAIPTIVWHELGFGCHRLPVSAKRTAIQQYLTEVVQRSIPILLYDVRAAQWHAAERARLAAAGTKPPFVDGQIASTAATNRLTFVTINVTDFSGFADLQVLNWQQYHD